MTWFIAGFQSFMRAHLLTLVPLTSWVQTFWGPHWESSMFTRALLLQRPWISVVVFWAPWNSWKLCSASWSLKPVASVKILSLSSLCPYNLENALRAFLGFTSVNFSFLQNLRPSSSSCLGCSLVLSDRWGFCVKCIFLSYFRYEGWSRISLPKLP